MTQLGTITMNMGPVLKGITVKVTISPRWTIRMMLGRWIIAFGCGVMGVRHREVAIDASH